MKAVLIAASMLALSAGAAAAQDGSLSSTSSSASFDVSATVVPMVRVSGLDDIALTINPATLASNFGTTNGETQFCVFSNVDAEGAYNVQVTGEDGGDGQGNPYGLIGQGTQTKLFHTVGYHDNQTYLSTFPTAFMRPSTVRASINTRGGQTRATTTDCAGGSNSSIRVGIRNPIAVAALADIYTGSLTVTVSVP